MARDERSTLQDLKTLTDKLPAVATAEWEKVARAFDLNPTIDQWQLPSFSVPHAYLPPSFHRRVMKDSIQWLDVYQERGSHKREAARVRLMDAWHVPVCALFKGRVVDEPQNPMPAKSGVQHKVYMLQGIILLVVELKLDLKDELDHVAQVLLELVSAYKLNSDKDFDPQPPVFAILTDLKDFYFFSYDGSTFKIVDEEIRVVTARRADFLIGMANVTQRLFSTILEGYVSILDAVVKRSERRGTIGDVSKHNSAESGKPTHGMPGRVRPSLDDWTRAARLAREAQTILVQCDCSNLEAWESTGQDGLRRLEASVSHLAKIGSLTDWDEEQIAREIDNVILSMRKPRVHTPVEIVMNTE